MLKNYLIVALRHLRRGRAFTFINVAGLALGLAACLLILLYVQDELSYDRHHEKADRLFRVTQAEIVATPAPLATALAEAYPSVTAYARILPGLGDVLIKKDGSETRFYEKSFHWADSTIFEVFSFPFVQGDPERALAEANTIVITEATATRYFGDDDPIGQTLIFDLGDFQMDFLVTGIMRNPPHNAHFRPDFLASMQTFEPYGFINLEDWSHFSFHTYVVLDEAASAEAVQASLPAFIARRSPELDPGYQLQPITDIHLHSKLRGELEPSGSASYVYSLSAVALLILLIACINFTNLATARSAHRAREIGMRKVLGAQRASLVVQLLGESVLLTLIALSLALPLAYLLLPLFNTLADKALTLRALNVPFLLIVVAGMTILVGMGAGSYPAFFLARFAPLRTLRGSLSLNASGLGVRKVLVVAQFSIGIVLILGTLVIYDQLRFIRAKDLGFDKERMIVISARMYGHSMAPIPFESMRQAFAAHAGVRRVAVTGDVPGARPNQSPFFLEGMTSQDDMARTNWNRYSVDYDVIETMGLDVIEGRPFSRDVPADETSAFIINEAALREARELLGPAWDAPLDKKIDRYTRLQSEWILGKRGRVIGVVRDFHYESLHHRIAPLVLHLSPASRDHFLIRLQTEDLPGTLAHLEATWKQFFPERPFEYYFLDASFDRLYRAEERAATLFSVFTGLSLIIACLGLFGLAAAAAEQRTKEIGLRKVLGASTTDIVVLLSKGFALLVLVAFAVAAPLAYLAAERWLESFAYKIEVGVGPFVLAGVLALSIALLTVSYQAVKAALTDPVESLRYE